MSVAMSKRVLQRENVEFRGTGGRSQKNRSLGSARRSSIKTRRRCILHASLTAVPRRVICWMGSRPKSC